MGHCNCRQFLLGTLLSIAVVAVFVVLAEFDADSLVKITREDGSIENFTAIFFGIASGFFLIFAIRSDFLKAGPRSGYLMTIGWILLMFIFMGEEISWGQRIFNIATPEKLAEINEQNEINIHNIESLEGILGGKYRWLSIMMFLTGLFFPLCAMSKLGRRVIQHIAFPVAPICYTGLFIGAYLYGKYYFHALPQDTASEVREFIFGVGMLSFALHGALSPPALFRINEKEKEPDGSFPIE